MTSQGPTPGKEAESVARQFSMAMQLPFVMVGGILVGGGLGYLLDRWFHTSPVLTLLGGAFGFGVAMRDILRSLTREEKRQKQGSGRGGK